MNSRERILMLLPTAQPETVEARAKLIVARDYCNMRHAEWSEWPRDHHIIHSLVSMWASRAAFAPWSPDDIQEVVEASRHLLTGTLKLKRLGDRHGD